MLSRHTVSPASSQLQPAPRSLNSGNGELEDGEECEVLGGAGSVEEVEAALFSPTAVRALFELAFGRVGFA